MPAKFVNKPEIKYVKYDEAIGFEEFFNDLYELRNKPLKKEKEKAMEKTTVGIEIEFDGIPRNRKDFVVDMNRLGWNIVHDASCESPAGRTPSGLTLSRSAISLIRESIEIGGELVSPVLAVSTAEDTRDMIEKTMENLAQAGETGISTRSSIHFHVGFPAVTHVRALNLLKLAGHLEKLFFQLGGMGYENRCVYNQAAYARPITGKGPVVVPTVGGEYVPAMVFEDVLESQSSSDFFQRYGDAISMKAGRIKYAPIRYHWINFYNLIKNNRTVEFRIFNYTLNTEYVLAALQLCLSFVETALKYNTPQFTSMGFDKQNSAFSSQSVGEILATLENYAEKTESLDENTLETLRTIIYTSPLFELEEYWVHCHLKNPTYLFVDEEEYRPKAVTGKIHKPNNIDLHMMEGEV